MENVSPKFVRGINNETFPLIKIQLEKVIASETGQNGEETIGPAPSSSGTSGSIIFKGNTRDVIAPMVCHGGINTVKVYPTLTSTPRQDRIEFNVQECIPSFFGREEFIENLHGYLWNTNPEQTKDRLIRSPSIVVCGLGGVGKTQVVRKYIQKYKSFYDHVLWINAESYTAATSQFLQLAGEIPKDVYQNGKQKPDEIIIEDIYDFVCRKLALVVFDNVESFLTDDLKSGLYRLLPKAVKTGWKAPAIIVTTRYRAWDNFKVQELAVFDLSESLSFLSLLQLRDYEDNPTLLQEVVEIFQGLPLALQQVVTFVRNKRELRAALDEGPYTIQDFLTDVANKRKKFMKTRPNGEDHPDVYTLFEMTFEQLICMKHGELALQCLDVTAILNPDNIQTVLIKTIFRHAKDKLAKVLNLLHTHNLLTLCGDYYQMHRVIQAARMESSNMSSKPSYVNQNYNQIVDLVQEFVQTLSTTTKNVHEILHNVIRIHDHDPNICTKKFLTFKEILAEKLSNVGNYTNAVQIYRTALGTSGTLWGVNHTNTVRFKTNLSNALQCQGNYSEAQQLINDILQTQHEMIGPFHPNTLSTKNNLATVLYEQGKFEEARKLYNNVLQIRNEILCPNHLDTLNTKSNLGIVLTEQGNFEEARKLYNDVLQKQIQILGPNHPEILSSKNNLAVVLYNEEKFEEARILYNDVLQTCDKTLGPNHPDTLKTKNNLAAVLDNQGKFEEARELYNDVLYFRIKILGPNHPETLSTKNNLAALLTELGKFEEARKQYKDVLQIRNEMLGRNHPDTLTTKYNLAKVLYKEGKFEDALELSYDVFQMQNEILGPNHPNTIKTKINLALACVEYGKEQGICNTMFIAF